jgi:hypothetical protein
MSNFDYTAIKSSLLSAGNTPAVQGAPITHMESFEKYMDRFSVNF